MPDSNSDEALDIFRSTSFKYRQELIAALSGDGFADRLQKAVADNAELLACFESEPENVVNMILLLTKHVQILTARLDMAQQEIAILKSSVFGGKNQ